MKRIFLMLMLLILILSGCGKEASTQREYEYGEEVVYQSDTSTEDCYLCGGGIESIVPWCWGQENVAFISLNTFEIKPLEINRYDRLDGHLITEVSGVVSFGGGASQDGGFSANLLLEYDRGYATGTLEFLGDKDLDLEKVSSFLCADCMNEILPQRTEKCFGVGVINLNTKEIKLFEENLMGFGVGDFYIEWHPYDEDSSKVHLIVVYCPVRYKNSSE